jgi:hypothetical protein
MRTGVKLVTTLAAGVGVQDTYLSYSGGACSIFFPLAGGAANQWVEIPFARYTNAGERADTFRWNEGYISTREGGLFTRGTQIMRQGEQETAIQSRVSVGGAVKSDHAGGMAHGDERLIAGPVVTRNGVAIDISGSGLVGGAETKVSCTTELLEVDNVTAVRLAEITKSLTFTRAGVVYDFSCLWVGQASGMTGSDADVMAACYMGMFSGLSGVYTAARLSSLSGYAVQDLTDGVNMAFSKPDVIVMYGPTYGVKMTPTAGWTKANRRARVDENVAGSNPKVYPDWLGSNYVPQVGETLTGQMTYMFGTASAVQVGLP